MAPWVKQRSEGTRRLTQAGDERLTESGDLRILEVADIWVVEKTPNTTPVTPPPET